MHETSHVSIRRLAGSQVQRHLDDVARLRIAVFREWPYLYAGDMGYERDYLAAYAASPGSLFVLAFDAGRVVGASTGLPLVDDGPAFRAPFEARGPDPAQVFYFGESVLLPLYRGQGIGRAFFDHREAHARQLGHAWTAFAAVERDAADPRRPVGHRGHERLWSGRGYTRRPELRMQLDWAEPGVGECSHALVFWTRPLEAAT